MSFFIQIRIRRSWPGGGDVTCDPPFPTKSELCLTFHMTFLFVNFLLLLLPLYSFLNELCCPCFRRSFVFRNVHCSYAQNVICLRCIVCTTMQNKELGDTRQKVPSQKLPHAKFKYHIAKVLGERQHSQYYLSWKKITKKKFSMKLDCHKV